MKKQLKCYIYTRVSTSMQVDGYSLDAQKDKLHKYADYQDMIIAGEYSDEGKSGKSVEGRPQFQQMLQDIESGKDLFLSVTVRQSLAKALKCLPEEIKALEKDFNLSTTSEEIVDSLKELILNGAGGLKCPVCGASLVTKVERMYDLEDNLVLHPKAHCSKCVFQITH